MGPSLLGPDVVTALEGLELVEPDIVFDGRWTVDLGGRSVVLQNWGPSHTADDQTVRVDHDVLFAGDLMQKSAFPIVPYFAPFDSHLGCVEEPAVDPLSRHGLPRGVGLAIAAVAATCRTYRWMRQAAE